MRLACGKRSTKRIVGGIEEWGFGIGNGDARRMAAGDLVEGRGWEMMV